MLCPGDPLLWPFNPDQFLLAEVEEDGKKSLRLIFTYNHPDFSGWYLALRLDPVALTVTHLDHTCFTEGATVFEGKDLLDCCKHISFTAADYKKSCRS